MSPTGTKQIRQTRMTSLFLLGGKTFSWDDLTPFFLSKGTERTCFINPVNEGQVLKVSLRKQAKQTFREVRYFRYLIKKKVPFTHIPIFYETIKNDEYEGFLQQAVRNKDGSLSIDLNAYCKEGGIVPKEELARFFYYFYRYNILPCDLNAFNIFAQETAEGVRLILIDGLGCTDFFPLAQYWPWWGRRKIIRKFIRFLQKDAFLQKQFSGKNEIKKWTLQLTKTKNPA